jgi:serine protease Do
MKKIVFIFLSIIVAGLGSIKIISQTTENTSTLTTTTTTIETTNYSDLVAEIYEEVYAQVYAEIYSEIMAEIDQEFYDTIYADYENKILELLNNEEIGVFYDTLQTKIYDVVALADISVFGVLTLAEGVGIAGGSGVVYKYDESSETFYLVTNQHVIEGGDAFEIIFSDESTVSANLIGSDEDTDIAVLTFKSEKTIVVSELGDSDSLERGQFIIAAGNPESFDFYGSITLGVISGLERTLSGNSTVKYIQHDAAINPGNSGGPIYNLEGKVVGINVAKYATSTIEGMGFSIPINTVKTIISEIENGN